MDLQQQLRTLHHIVEILYKKSTLSAERALLQRANLCIQTCIDSIGDCHYDFVSAECLDQIRWLQERDQMQAVETGWSVFSLEKQCQLLELGDEWDLQRAEEILAGAEGICDALGVPHPSRASEEGAWHTVVRRPLSISTTYHNNEDGESAYGDVELEGLGDDWEDDDAVGQEDDIPSDQEEFSDDDLPFSHHEWWY
ncbi:hypothetical protein G7054_g6661 [Neopestalotiopsis clavispora]|nr:hypothetical protein G7054_g6661 [Neopestalotiopsis clavispora]